MELRAEAELKLNSRWKGICLYHTRIVYSRR